MRASAIMHAEFGTLVIDGVTAPFSSSPSLAETDLVMTVTGDDLVIRTGVNMGPVKVDFELLPSAPQPEGDNGWEDMVEVRGQSIPGESISVHGPTEMPLVGVDSMVSLESEAVAVRVYSAGRSNARDLAVDEPTESYLIQVWPPGEDGGSKTENWSGGWSAVSLLG